MKCLKQLQGIFGKDAGSQGEGTVSRGKDIVGGCHGRLV